MVSTSSAFRYEDDVPIIVPGVNHEHAALVKRQQRERGWKGFVVPIPNCTTTGLVVALAPLARRFGLRSVIMTSMQALSGAGRSPGVHSMDILDNVIPYIPKEEEKVQRETSKILGTLEGDRIVPLELPVSAHCNRVNVRDGHMECVSAGLGRAASLGRGRRTRCAPSAASSPISGCPPRRPSCAGCSTTRTARSRASTATRTTA